MGSYKNDPQILAMTNLVAAYQDRNVEEAEKILRGKPYDLHSSAIADGTVNKATITDDPFIAYFITDLLRSLRTQFIIDLIKPYTRLELQFVAKVSLQLLPLDRANEAVSQRQSRRSRGSGGIAHSGREDQGQD
jgi:hypothetical protein